MRAMEHPLYFGTIVGCPYVATTFGIIRMALSCFVRRWDTHLGSLTEEDQVTSIPKIHSKLVNVTTETNGRAAVGDVMSTSPAESVTSLGVVIVPRTKR